ncbi:hypothetical protein V8E53_006132 [Lactarius tabidus]
MLSLIHIIDGGALLSFLIAFRAIHRYQRRKRFPYPPGWPLIGNLLYIPNSFPWLAFTEYSKKYGHIVSYSFLGEKAVVLNSIKAIKDLLERRGDVYSDRSSMQFINMMEWHWKYQ